MSDSDVVALVEPLVRHGAFPSAETAVRELVSDYILRQIDECRAEIVTLEKRYGMSFAHFGEHLKARAQLLTSGQIESAHRQTVARALMREEEDWLDWKIARESLQEWLGLQPQGAT